MAETDTCPVRGIVHRSRATPCARCDCLASLRNERVRRPVSRVLSTPRKAMDGHSSGTPVTERLARPTRAAARKPALPVARRAAPIWSCSRWGLPCRLRYRSRGGLLPHRFTLALRPKPRGGLFSVALSLGSPRAGVTRRHFSLEPGLSSTRRVSPGAAVARPSARRLLGPPRGGAPGVPAGAEPVAAGRPLTAAVRPSGAAGPGPAGGRGVTEGREFSSTASAQPARPLTPRPSTPFAQ